MLIDLSLNVKPHGGECACGWAFAKELRLTLQLLVSCVFSILVLDARA